MHTAVNSRLHAPDDTIRKALLPLRLLAIAALVAFAPQALAVGGQALACRYTGEIFESCPEGQPVHGRGANLEADGCCITVGSASAHLSAVRVETKSKALDALPVPVPAAPFEARAPPPLVTRPRPQLQDGPPPERLFIRVRHLLL